MRVLLVDDHLDGLEITAKLLRMEGFDVVTASNCTDALNKAQERDDLIVTDLGLPDGTGMDLYERLREIYQFLNCNDRPRRAGFSTGPPTESLFVICLSRSSFLTFSSRVREGLGLEPLASSPEPA